jgi:benzaldehyde dehydrogenase (NAD)
MEFERVGPLAGLAASRAIAMQPDDIEQVVARARQGFEKWSGLGPNARRGILHEAASALERKADLFVDAMLREIGANEMFARLNVAAAANIVREAAALTTQIAGDVIPSDKPGCVALSIRAPVGVLLGIAPWNAPIILGVRAIAVPLACGNAVILKASETCPRTHALIVEAFNEAGFPEGAVGIVTHAPQDAGKIVGALIDHPDVKRINFTGSTTVGRIIAMRAAQNLKPVVLELGGKAPLVVLEDANLKEAVKAAAFGAFVNQGQICMSTERVIVVDSVAEQMASALAEKARALVTVDPREGVGHLGAVADVETIDRINRLIDDAVSKGATVIAGGKSNSVLMSATVIDHVSPDMDIYHDESFGPLVAIMRAKDEADAVRMANDTPYGLSAAVFTESVASGLRVAGQIKSGICHINGATVFDEPQMPFGGQGASGYGRFGGKAGIDSFTELRWITINTEAAHYPF